MTENTHTNLFEEFEEVSAKQWKQKIQFELKGEDYNDNLVWESLEGINVKPFYTKEDIDNLTLPSLKYPDNWQIQKSIHLNSEVKSDYIISKKAEGYETFRFIIKDEKLPISIEEIKNLLNNTSVHFDIQSSSNSDYHELVEGNFSVLFDPISHLVKTGNWFNSLNSDLDYFQNSYKRFGEISVNTETYQNAGANIIQQLTYALSHAKEYCDRVSNFETPKAIHFRVSVGSNYFFEIAKLRALRWLWQSLSNHYNWRSCSCIIHAVPSKRNKTIYDYNTNMLRTTTECMSAILGGADYVENQPYDAIYHHENDFGDRISKNQLLILKEESYFNAVHNAADGTYYIEELTHNLATKTLNLLKDIDRSGGFLKQLKEGTIQKKIKESAYKEQKAFDDKNLLLVGTNYQPNSMDRMKEELEISPFPSKEKRKTLIEPIIEKRLSEKLEKERLQKEKIH